MKEQTIQDRLRQVIEYTTNGNQSAFGRLLGVKQNVIGNWLNPSRPVDMGIINKILTINPDISIDWLKTGEGSMLKSDKPKYNEVTPIPEGEYMMVEYADLRASAGKLGVGDVELLPETHRRLVPKEYANGKFLVVGVDGDSMNDGTSRSLGDGDEILICQHEGGIMDALPIKKRLFVITTLDGNVLKQITEVNREEGYIVCHSFNPAYEDFKIKFDDICQIFIVYKIVQKQISLI